MDKTLIRMALMFLAFLLNRLTTLLFWIVVDPLIRLQYLSCAAQNHIALYLEGTKHYNMGPLVAENGRVRAWVKRA